jgi:hypothetical protein
MLDDTGLITFIGNETSFRVIIDPPVRAADLMFANVDAFVPAVGVNVFSHRQNNVVGYLVHSEEEGNMPTDVGMVYGKLDPNNVILTMGRRGSSTIKLIPNFTTTADGQSEGLITYFTALCWPNPFKEATMLNVFVPFLPQPGLLDITLFDILGRQIKSVYSNTIPAGCHTIMIKGDDLPVGTYFARIAHNGIYQSVKLNVIK